MVINEAKMALARDSRRLMKAVDRGMGPEKIGPAAFQQILQHLKADASPSVRKAIDVASTAPVPATTHSEKFGRKLSAILSVSIDRLEPDFARGILYYVCGDQRQHGMGVLALELLDESAGLEVTAELLKWRSALLEKMRLKDQAFLSAVKELPPAWRNIANGSLYRAKLMLEVGDERSALMSFRQVRKLVLLHRRRKKVRS